MIYEKIIADLISLVIDAPDHAHISELISSAERRN